MDRPNRQSLAGSAGDVRPLESTFTRFRDWVKADVWKRLFEAISDDPDMEYAMVDATIVKVHRHGQGAKGGRKARRSAARKAA
ncbi:transposase [Bradyrhizobium sp. LB7.2]